MDESLAFLEGVSTVQLFGGFLMLMLTAASAFRKEPGSKHKNDSNNGEEQKLDRKLMASTSSAQKFSDLSPELLLQVLQYLDTDDILFLSATCKQFSNKIIQDWIWEQLWRARYGGMWQEFAYLRNWRSIHWDPYNNWGHPTSGWFVFYLEFEYCWANWLLAGVNNRDYCYLVLNHKIHDVTAFVADHPGSAETMLEHCGGDATQTFLDISHSMHAKQLSAKFVVGAPAYTPPHEDKSLIIQKIIQQQSQQSMTHALMKSLQSTMASMKRVATASAQAAYSASPSHLLSTAARHTLNAMRYPMQLSRLVQNASTIAVSPKALYDKLNTHVIKPTADALNDEDVSDYEILEALDSANHMLGSTAHRMYEAAARSLQSFASAEPETTTSDLPAPETPLVPMASTINMRHHIIYCLEVEKLAIMNYVTDHLEWCRQLSQSQSKITTLDGHMPCTAAATQHITHGNNVMIELGLIPAHCGQPRLFYDPLSQDWTIWWSCCALGEVVDREIIQTEIEKLPMINSSSKRFSRYVRAAYSEYVVKNLLRKPSLDEIALNVLQPEAAEGAQSSSSDAEGSPPIYEGVDVPDDLVIDEDEHVVAELLAEVGHVFSASSSRAPSVDGPSPAAAPLGAYTITDYFG